MEEEISVEHLKTVYKAQTEAYLEFNMALINILSNQKDILNKVESLKVVSDDEFKNLSKEYHALEKLFINFQNTQIARDQAIEGSTDDFKATITNFNEDLNKVAEEVRSLKKIQWEMKNFWNRVTAVAGGIVFFLTLLQLITGKGLVDLFK
jgi:predicted transcriptional regulator